MRAHRIAMLFLASWVVGCGARTGFGDEPPATLADAGLDDGELDASVDVSIDVSLDAEDAGEDVLPDAPLTDVGCSRDAECDDGIDCTDDVCDPDFGRCRNVPLDGRCDDGLFCTGTERCDATRGCVTTPRSCADPIACTVDTCDETTKSCVRTPDDALCPISHVCDALKGCQARAIAHTDDEILEIRLPSGEVNPIGPTTGTLTDIALHPDGTLYGVRSTSICVVDLKTGSCTSSVALRVSLVGLDVAPDGTIWGAGGNRLYRVDPKTGTTTPSGTFPPGLVASGDLAVLGTRILATARSTGGADIDTLVELMPSSGTSKVLGSIGRRCVWGLAAYGPTLYGLTCEGAVLRIDPTNGKSTQLSKIDAPFWGATAR